MTWTEYTHAPMELWGCIFCLIAALCIHISKDTFTTGGRLFFWLQVTNALLLLMDSLSWIFRGHPGVTGYYMVHITNFLVFVLGYVMLAIFTEYVACFIGQDTGFKRIWKKVIHLLCITAIACVIISQFNDMYYYFDDGNFYHRNYAFMFSQLFGIAGTLINGIVLVKYRQILGKKLFLLFISYIVLPATAMIIQLFVYGLTLLNLAITISLLLMFIILQVERGKKLTEQAQKLIEQERAVSDMQVQIVLSQIQPHFLYNSLNSIYYLCGKSPATAQKAISNFADYLRVNLDSLKCNTPIPFDMELRHTKIYLALEKMRFDDMLNIEYNINTINFMLPSLSVQPLVENAVKYGVGKKTGGGTVTITTREESDHYEIIVSDDGVGFDPHKVQDDRRSHIGIENVKYRLHTMSNASLEVVPIAGEGTTSTIKIPKQPLK